jgi:hypothetical protein
MAIHWNGTKWAALSPPNPIGCTGNSYLTAVSVVEYRDVWVAGSCGSGGSTPQQGYVENWNGLRWSVIGAYGSLPAYSQLNSISTAGPRNVWAVGNTQQAGSSQPVALAVHWDGTKWDEVGGVSTAVDGNLEAVVTGLGRSTWAVGSGTSPQPPFAGPLSISYRDGTWQDVKLPLSFGSLAGVAVEQGGHLWTVGSAVNQLGLDAPIVLTRPLR